MIHTPVMRCRAWAFAGAIVLLGAAINVLALGGLGATSGAARLTCAAFAGAATFAQLRAVRTGDQAVLHLTPVFIFAAIFVLPSSLITPLVVAPPLAAWAQERRLGSHSASRWWIHLFNSGMLTLMAFGARGVVQLLGGPETVQTLASPGAAVVAAIAATTFVGLNYAVGGLFLAASRGVPWRHTGLLDGDNLAIELSLVGLGCAVAALWWLAPWFVPAVFAPVVLMHRALAIPRLKREAQVDAKTGLATARHFDSLFAVELDRARRFNRPLSVLMADLDHFKALNDTYGHLVGDAVLAGVGSALQVLLRDFAIVGRFGGEEFAIALPEKDAAAAHAVAERIRRTIAAERFAIPGRPLLLQVTVSIGVASFPRDGDSPAALLHAADAAAYRAKSDGRDCVRCVDTTESLPGTSAGISSQVA